MIKMLAGLLLATAACGVQAQAQADYPNKPLRLVVPFAPGGGADLVARAIAGPLAKRLGQTVLVDNKPGGGATLGADLVAKAPADGLTLLYATPGPQITNRFLMPRLPYDPDRDLVPVSTVAVVPNVLVVHPDLPVRNVRELIAYAKANPGKLNFASAGLGASSHLAGELFKQAAGVDIVHVPYKGTGPALTDLLSGQVQMAIDSIVVYQGHIEAGKLRALGVATPQRSPQLPGVPPIADALPGFDAAPMNYIAVRAGTPPTIIERLNREINAVVADPELVASLVARGVTPGGSSVAALQQQLQSETMKWKKVIEVSGAKLE